MAEDTEKILDAKDAAQEINRVANALWSLLDDDYTELLKLQAAAAEALGEVKAGALQDNMRALIKALTRSLQPGMNKQEHVEVVESAKGSIVTFGNLADASTKKSIIKDLVDALKRNDVKTFNQIMIIQALGEIGDTKGISIDPLLEFVNDDNCDVELRTEAVRSLAKIVNAMRKDMERQQEDMKRHVVIR